MVFSLISKETRCVHPPHLPAPLPNPPSVIFFCQNNPSHPATFQSLCQQLSPYETSALPACWPCSPDTPRPHPQPVCPAHHHPVSFQNPVATQRRCPQPATEVMPNCAASRCARVLLQMRPLTSRRAGTASPHPTPRPSTSGQLCLPAASRVVLTVSPRQRSDISAASCLLHRRAARSPRTPTAPRRGAVTPRQPHAPGTVSPRDPSPLPSDSQCHGVGGSVQLPGDGEG